MKRKNLTLNYYRYQRKGIHNVDLPQKVTIVYKNMAQETPSARFETMEGNRYDLISDNAVHKSTPDYSIIFRVKITSGKLKIAYHRDANKGPLGKIATRIYDGCNK